MEHVYKHLQPLSKEVRLLSPAPQQAPSEGSDPSESDVEELISLALDHIDTLIYRVLTHCVDQQEGGMKKHIFHLAWSPDTLPTEEAITPLFSFLGSHLTQLNTCLLAGNFLRTLHVTWESVLTQLREHADRESGEKMPLFYDRLDEALQMLTNYFLCEERGLEPARLYSDNYRELELVFGLAKMSTDQLMEEYYRERLRDQFSITSVPEFGKLEVRVYFRNDTLCVEIFSARDIIPLDPNGLSDPFVTVELLPKRIFSCQPEKTTAVQKSTLNPQFEETFEFSCRKDQCRVQEAMVCFTLMDYDVITANDFGGEAFVPLNSISGVEHGSSSVDNFHGLKPIQLPLMFQKQKDNPILDTLEARKSDKQAQDFIKRQRARFQE